MWVYIYCRVVSKPDSKFGIQNRNSNSDQYSSPCVTRLHKIILEWIPIGCKHVGIHLCLCMIFWGRFFHFDESPLCFLEFLISLYSVWSMESTHVGRRTLVANVFLLCHCEVPLEFCPWFYVDCLFSQPFT